MLKKIIEIIIFTSSLSACFSVSILLISYASGWNELARYYKTEQSPPVDLLNEQSGKIGGYSYKNAINVGVSEQGLYLSVNSFIRFLNMPPLLIPWEAVIHVRPDNNSFFGEGYQLDIGIPIITTLILPRTALKKAQTILETKQ